MNVKEAIEYLYGCMPSFERNGASDYKPGLERVSELDAAFLHPSRAFPTIHVAGTNGKGTTAHALASVLHAQGLRVGLFTSPHLVNFGERIRVDGQMIPDEAVADFVNRYVEMRLPLAPSFFELTTVMAFDWFRTSKVDIAVIETGLGGRLDSTNIIHPLISVITNIALDHTDLLGDSIAQIAAEKGGIIKPETPVVVSACPDDDAREVLTRIAHEHNAPITFADRQTPWEAAEENELGQWMLRGTPYGDIPTGLSGDFQSDNLRGIITALTSLPIHLDSGSVKRGLSAEALHSMGLKARWSILGRNPLVIADTGHNPDAWQRISRNLGRLQGHKHVVCGFVSDKDVEAILKTLEEVAPLSLYLTTPHGCHRAMKAETLNGLAERILPHAWRGVFPDVDTAYQNARNRAVAGDVVFVGGSNYLIGQFSALR